MEEFSEVVHNDGRVEVGSARVYRIRERVNYDMWILRLCV